ncbi:DEAD/DEAH box helicase [Alicyclobacillus macrosporangiidus]|uniref:Helicase conserved C-terminal domain-containing protein n=1 Tax=Alicyclobacillus macrosporangiidus TaxID=392015 RepID=A0A1I7JWZ7_9BACL|nr:SNF2-related protein [Alicyclobacillus macrosporangiidus]SFU89697.1 Helicase conserved C-terminal domain-containing protein [Alicyclobacillus macrosporangiidus]
MTGPLADQRMPSTTPPIYWTGQDSLYAFTAYLETEPVGNQAAWNLFRLTATAIQARMAPAFDDLMALGHVVGFTPLPHQVATAKQVIQEMHGRAILADEVGLGKTIEAGLIMKEYLLRGLARKILVLVPASLVLQWTRELNEKFRIRAFAQRHEANWAHYDVIVASLDTAKREPHRSAVLGVEWDMVVVDEAHKLKNSRTKNWQMVNQIPNKYMLLLTATPMQNHLAELHTLITLLQPGRLGNRGQFVQEHTVTARTPKNPAALRAQLTEVMIRNRRRDGAAALPDRHVHVVPLELNPAERTLYDAVQQFLRGEYEARMARRGSVLPLITLQREICSSPYAALLTLEKMLKRTRSDEACARIAELMQMAQRIEVPTKVETVLRMLDEIPGKCIVFTEYRATQDFLMYMLRKRGVPAVPFRGGFRRGKKDWMKDLFANRARVLVATESGGEGINLQFCHHMINFDLPWNPMKLEQRIGRIHRLGQTEEVHVYNLSTRNTIEAHIVELLQEKIRMFEMVIGELDYILGDPKRLARFEEEILNLAMTSISEDELRERLHQYGEQVLRPERGGVTK